MTNRRSLLDRLLRIYPRIWRERYGDELRDLVDEMVAKNEFSETRVTFGLLVSGLVERVRSARLSRRTVVVAGMALAVVAVGVAAIMTGGSPKVPSAQPTEGTIPSTSNGSLDLSKVPDFVSAVGRTGGIVGYIPKAYLIPGSAHQSVNSKIGSVAPVYASDLTTLVGHMYPGVGFVPLGTSPASEPCTRVTTGERLSTGQIVTNVVACPSTTETVQLSSESLQASITYAHSSSVTGGHVVNVMPKPGSKVAARSVLTVVSSLGPP